MFVFFLLLLLRVLAERKIRGMQQGDQTVLSLRPGGGRGGRLLGPSSLSSASSNSFPAFGSFSSDLPLLRPHGGAPPTFFLKVFIQSLSVFLDLGFSYVFDI